MMSYPVTQRMLSSAMKTIPYKQIVNIADYIRIFGIKNIPRSDLDPLITSLQRTKSNTRNSYKEQIVEMLILKIKNYISETPRQAQTNS